MATSEKPVVPQGELPAAKAPGPWLLARLGKRVLRPGGLELTQKLLGQLEIGQNDRVVEFAPGLGVTALLALGANPASYTAVERDSTAAAIVTSYLTGPNQRCVLGTAETTGLSDASSTVVYGEAMLSMQPAEAKSRIIAEAARLLTSGGRFGLHELSFASDDVAEPLRREVQRELSEEIHVGVRLLTPSEWRELLQVAGFKVVACYTAPMHLLEPRRLIKDEGFAGAIRFLTNVAIDAAARRRVLAMRRVFRKYERELAAIALVAVKQPEHAP